MQEQKLIIEITQYQEAEGIPVCVRCYYANGDDEADTKEGSTAVLHGSCIPEEELFAPLKAMIGDMDAPLKKDDGVGKWRLSMPIVLKGIINDDPKPFFKQTEIIQSVDESNRKKIKFYSIFEQGVEIEGEFVRDLDFADSVFKGALSLKEHAQLSQAIFNRCVFHDVVLFRHSVFHREARFDSCTFMKTMDCDTCTFEQESSFHACMFEGRATFDNVRFEDSVYFHDSTFKDKGIFHSSCFSRLVNFHSAVFENIPDFSACIFEDSKGANFIGVDVADLSIDVLKEHIIKEVADKHTPIIRAWNLRDSFRVIKEVLIGQANFLEAQKWHKLELYAKEIELECRLEIESLRSRAQIYLPSSNQATNQIMKGGEKQQLRNRVDRFVLQLYRHTSDHHTNLLRIVMCVVMAIGYFGGVLLMLRGLRDEPFRESLNLVWVLLFVMSGVACSAVASRWKCSKRLSQAMGVGVALALCVACYDPELLFGITKIIQNQSLGILENLLIVLYTLVMILLIFSLQKTARKNSIIPR